MAVIGSPVQFREGASEPWWAAVIIDIPDPEGAPNVVTVKATTPKGAQTTVYEVPPLTGGAVVGPRWRELPGGS